MKSDQRCKSCGAEIVYLTTNKGNMIPVDAASVEQADEVFEYTKHISHFATCPNAKAHRSPSLPKGYIVP